MLYKKALCLCFVIICTTNGLKVNMQGSLTFGRDVMDAVTHYVKKYNVINGRRDMVEDNQKADIISSAVQSASLCHKLDFCKRELKTFINVYVVALDVEVERIIEDVKQNNQVHEETNGVKENSNNLIFKEQLKVCLKDIKRILKTADAKISEENEAYIWTDIIKKISAKFQETAKWFVNERLNGNPQHTDDTKLIQEIIIGTVKVENRYQSKLCTELNICMKSHECTNGLNSLLTQFNNTSEEKVKNFVRTFYELLPETGFYRKLKDSTATEFQVVLNDMSYGNVVNKDVFMTLHKTLDGSLKPLDSKVDVSKEKDVELIYAILSDMDHFYSKHKPEPFYKFLDSFNEWSKFGGRLTPHVKQLMKDISHQLSIESEALVDKLVNEVKVFLEITVDPEK